MSSQFIKICFYPSLAYNVLMEKITARQWYTKIDDSVILGALPFKWMTKKLVEKEGVKAVVSLNEDFELKLCNSQEEWNKYGVTLLKLPTPDLVSAPSQRSLLIAVEFLKKCCDDNIVAYVHCKAGRTRSSTVVACYLMMVNDWPPSKAIDKIREKRPHVWLRAKQLQAIDCFYKENVVK